MNAERADLSRARLARADIYEEWERNYLGPDLDRYYRAAFSRIVGELQDSTGNTVLDLGCGYCHHTVRLGESNLSITGADFSEADLARARDTLRNAGLGDRVAARRADASNLPFSDSSFDNVLMWGVLMHIPEAETAFAEAARVLKPGGNLILSENDARSLEVVFLERLVNLVKRVIGRKPHGRKRSPMGIAEWQSAGSGGLMVRKTGIPALARVCQNLGLRLEKRFAGQFTEAYVRVPSKIVKRTIHAFNRFYFEHVRHPGPSLSNILVFIKESVQRSASGARDTRQSPIKT